MNFLYTVLKFFLVLLLWTAVGQIHIKGESLENKYHRGINSAQFQKYFWGIATPVTWTKDQVEKLIESQKRKVQTR